MAENEQNGVKAEYGFFDEDDLAREVEEYLRKQLGEDLLSLSKSPRRREEVALSGDGPDDGDWLG